MPVRVHPKVKDGELTKKECEECCTYGGKVMQRKMKVRGWEEQQRCIYRGRSWMVEWMLNIYFIRATFSYIYVEVDTGD